MSSSALSASYVLTLHSRLGLRVDAVLAFALGLVPHVPFHYFSSSFFFRFLYSTSIQIAIILCRSLIVVASITLYSVCIPSRGQMPTSRILD